MIRPNYDDLGALQQAPIKPARLPELDSLRGLAAVSVVFGHFRMLWLGDGLLNSCPGLKRIIIYLTDPFCAGHEAVILFFILSGYVLAIPAITTRAQPYSVFIVRRIFRVYLPYLVAILFAIAGDMIFHGYVTNCLWFHQFWSTPVDWKLVGDHIAFLGNYNTDQLNSPIWSLVYEMRISIIFPLLCVLALLLKPAYSIVAAITVSGLAIIALNVWRPGGNVTALLITLHYAALFIIGICLARQKDCIAELMSRVAPSTKTAGLLVSAWFYIFAGALWNGLLVRLTNRSLPLSDDWFTAIGASGLIVISLNSTTFKRVLLWRPIHNLGKVSYSIYLLHFIILLVLVHLLYGKAPFPAIFALCFVVTLAVSWQFYRMVEAPFIGVGRRLSGYMWALDDSSAKRTQSMSRG